MTRLILLERLKELTEEATRDLLLPVKPQKEAFMPPKETSVPTKEVFMPPEVRQAGVYRMRLTKSSSAQKTAPYIIHQLITGKDERPGGGSPRATATVRSIFCVYHDDEEEGALALVGLMERLRIALLRRVVIGGQFQLDLEVGLEVLAYPEDTAPFYAGEMMSTWILPAVEREVMYR